MKILLTTLLLFLSTISWSQSAKTAKSEQLKFDLIGIWTLTDFNKPEEFSDTWEFTTDSLFRELKYLSDGDTTMAPDENGTWSLKETLLTITATGEESYGKQVLYDEPQIIKLQVSKLGEDILISIISWGDITDKEFPTLRLTRE